jgi:hypothetical protein
LSGFALSEIVEVERFANTGLTCNQPEIIELLGELGVLAVIFRHEPHSLAEPCENGIEVIRKPIEPFKVLIIAVVSNRVMEGLDLPAVLVEHTHH